MSKNVLKVVIVIVLEFCALLNRKWMIR